MILLVIIVILLGVFTGYVYSKFGMIDYDNNINKEDIEINEGVEIATGYKNIYLFGVDSRKNEYENALSDVIMVVSINQDTKKVKIASVYRDTYLQFTNSSYDKVTHAFLQRRTY